MFFLNFSALEFFTLLGALGGFVTALYLLDRRKRKRVVSTLRFWVPSANVEDRRSRRHMQQPWSLLLQLLSLALLLLALAQLQWGSRAAGPRDHVLLLDASAWSGAHQPGTNISLLDQEIAAARSYIGSLPAADRVLLVKTDALASPLAPFTANRRQLRTALQTLTAGFSALDLDAALAFAAGSLKWSPGTGEIVYLGPAKTDHVVGALPRNLRIISFPAPAENCGIRAASAVRASDNDANGWKASFTLRNDGVVSHRVRLAAAFAGTHFAARTYILKPAVDTLAEYSFTTRTSGSLTAEMSIEDGSDALASDNRAEIALPLNAPVNVLAYTRRRNLLAPLLEAGRELSVKYLDPAQYAASARADLLFFDEVAPAHPPASPALYMHPARAGSPLPVKTVVHDAGLAGWSSEGLRELGSGQTGLREKEMRFGEADVFETFRGDIPVASVLEGPVIVIRNSGGNAPRLAAIGFDLLNPALRADLTTPLLLANLFYWLSPEAFRPVDYSAGQVGAVSVPLEPGESAASLRALDAAGHPLPFSIRGGNLQLFVDRPQTLRLTSNVRERILSLSLPNVPHGTWNPPAALPSGIPAPFRFAAAADLWPWLAAAGGLGLLAEWLLFGRARRAMRRAPPLSQASSSPSRERIPA